MYDYKDVRRKVRNEPRTQTDKGPVRTKIVCGMMGKYVPIRVC